MANANPIFHRSEQEEKSRPALSSKTYTNKMGPIKDNGKSLKPSRRSTLTNTQLPKGKQPKNLAHQLIRRELRLLKAKSQKRTYRKLETQQRSKNEMARSNSEWSITTMNAKVS